MSLNVCGIKRKLQYPEFINFISNYDILCFVESKTDDTDVIEIPGFVSHMKNRTQVARIRSGGIIFAVRDSLNKCINVRKSNSDFVFWFTLSKDTDNIYPDTLFGVIYIPPENTKYSSPECFFRNRTRNVGYFQNF